MRSTFDRAADVIADSSCISRELIKPESHILDDLAIDSLDFLDSVHALDKEFGIKLPVERFADDELMEMPKLVACIDELTAQRAAPMI
jgi:acyl carrier protein